MAVHNVNYVGIPIDSGNTGNNFIAPGVAVFLSVGEAFTINVNMGGLLVPAATRPVALLSPGNPDGNPVFSPLPTWMTIDNSGWSPNYTISPWIITITGTAQGTPGTYKILLWRYAQNWYQRTIVDITVGPAPALNLFIPGSGVVIPGTTDYLTDGVRGTPFSLIAPLFVIGSIGPSESAANITLTIQNLPPGLSQNADGTVNGTPTTIERPRNVIYHAHHNTISLPDAYVTYRFFIHPEAPAITNALPPAVTNGEEGVAFSYQITSTATDSPGGLEYDAIGLPDGLTVDTSTGLISGTPTAFSTPSDGFFYVDLLATSSFEKHPPATGALLTRTGNRTVLFHIKAHNEPTITSELTKQGFISTAFSYSIIATRNPTSYSASPLPSGLSADAFGNITGTPTTMGVFNVTITAANAYGTDTETLVITIGYPPPTILGDSNVGVLLGDPFSYQIEIDPLGSPVNPTNGFSIEIPGPIYGNSGLPDGLSLDVNTGLVTGTPTEAGSFLIIFKATNDGYYAGAPSDPITNTSSKGVLLVVFTGPPVPTSVVPANGEEGVEYEVEIAGTNFISGGVAKVLIGSIQDGYVIVDSVFNSTTSITATIPETLVIKDTAYDIVVQNYDGQTGILVEAYKPLPANVRTIAGVAYSLLPESRAFALGTNVETMFYSGRDVPGNRILNVHRRQMGTTSTAHLENDLVFKGMLSIQASPLMYEIDSDTIDNVYCIVKADGRIELVTLKNNGSNEDDKTKTAYAAYLATLVKSVAQLPFLKLEGE